MEFWRIISSAVVGTTVMTIFSYVMAGLNDNQFKEPQLLNKLLDSSKNISVHFHDHNAAGWFIHYAIGAVFIILFSLIWNFTGIAVSWFSAAGFGFVAGIIGVIGWESMFNFNAAPPDIQLKKFFVQLLIAHVIFALAAFIVYRLW